MSFLSDLGGIISDFQDIKDEVSTAAGSVKKDFIELADQAAKPIQEIRDEGTMLKEQATQLGDELQGNLPLGGDTPKKQ